MAISDPIADFITKIRNASQAKHRFVDIRWSKLKQNIAEILKNQGFIESYLVKQDNKNRGTIRIFLKYTDGRLPVISTIQRISTPGLRKYIGHDDIPRFYGGLGLSIISTSQGVMAGSDARTKGIGGELLCMVS
jgi:small subunit ribosomal protein S8